MEARCLNLWTAREVPLCGCLKAMGAREEVPTVSHPPGPSGGAVATCSKHSGAPQLQGCVGEALVLKGPSQASPPHLQHLGLPCSGARPGLGLALCSQLPQPARESTLSNWPV